MCKETECDPNKAQIRHVVLRNFSGYDGFDPWKVFEGTQLNNFPSIPDKHEKWKEWREKLHDAFKDDETAHESLRNEFMRLQSPSLSQELLQQKFEDELRRGVFCDQEIQQHFEKDLNKYTEHKFETKVMIIQQIQFIFLYISDMASF